MTQRSRARGKVVHGDDLLYRFFQDLLVQDPDLAARMPQLLLMAMGVWLPLDAYERWPLLLPWVVRDPKCRGNRAKGVPDQWSSPDPRGFLRDDNSLVKGLPRSLTVRGPRGSHMAGARLGSEFVASHVWRLVKHDQLASRIALLNSFVPNLVWLPGQIAKLTDREGGIVQKTLQAMALAIYRRAPVQEGLRPLVEDAWAYIPESTVELVPFGVDSLNWFVPTERFYMTRATRLESVVSALDAIEAGRALPTRVVTTRYAAGLPLVDAAARASLKRFLLQFSDRAAQ
jgi:hypothetical protein